MLSRIHFFTLSLIIVTFLTTNSKCHKHTNLVQFPPLEDVVKEFGYPYENHTVTTDDGWILTTSRIPFQAKKGGCSQKKGTVLLVHGIYNNAAVFVYLGPHKSIGLLLADECYDVWLANSRGTRYTKHKKYGKNEKQYWNFSIDELANYDTASLLKYITHTTGERKIHYIGFSQGTTQIMALLANKPDYQKYISSVHLVAPTVYVTSVEHYPQWLPPEAVTQALQYAPELFYRSFPDHQGVLSNMVFDSCRSKERNMQDVCDFTMDTFFAGKGDPKWVIHFPEPISLKTLAHYAQLHLDDDFQMYNYGAQKNKEVYGTIKQPSYQLDKIQSPVYIYHALGDDYSRPADIKRLIQHLPNVKLNHFINRADFGHNEFMIYNSNTTHLFHQHLFNALSRS